MARTPNIYGGGARTNTNGLHFEQTTSLEDALKNARYNVHGTKVYDGEKLIGLSVPKNKIYSCFLEPNGIDYTYYNSKKWLPDECFIHLETKVAYIIEKKFQNCEGSVDECKCQHRNAIKFRNENVVFFRYDYLSSGSTKS